eukprot:c21196_g1_i1.p1 GENE.c21196_g1_i1~~c21196_g1_i1.p1  ORF type:complete len:170 (-),score=33.14 c21196_g1_i1:11-451(-)
MASASDFQGPIIVTFFYFIVYYITILNVVSKAFGLKKKYETEGKVFDRYFSQDRVMLSADRGQLNMLEQMIPFMTLFWLYAVVVDVKIATILGGLYTFFRALYVPLSAGPAGMLILTKLVFFSTIPQYLIIFYFAFALVVSAFHSV